MRRGAQRAHVCANRWRGSPGFRCRGAGYLDVKLGSPQQVEGGVPHGVRGERDLFLELLQAVPQLSSSVREQLLRTVTRLLPPVKITRNLR